MTREESIKKSIEQMNKPKKKSKWFAGFIIEPKQTDIERVESERRAKLCSLRYRK